MRPARKWLLYFLGFTLVLSIFWWGYQISRNHIENRLLQEAEAKLKDGDIDEAIRRAFLAYQRNPSSYKAARLNARCYERVHSGIAMQWWQKTLSLKPDDFDSFCRVISFSVALGSNEQTRKWIESAHPSFQNKPDFHKLSAMTYLDIGQLSSAFDAFESALKLQPDDPEARLGKWLIQSQSSDPIRARSAYEALRELSRPGQPTEERALFNWITSNLRQRLQPGEICTLAKRYLQLGDTEFSRRAQVAATAARHCPDQKPLWFAALEAEALATPPLLVAYGNALNQNGESQRVLRLETQINSFREKVPLLHDVFLDALILQQQWNPAQNWIDSIPEDHRLPWHQLVREVAAHGGDPNQMDKTLIRLQLGRIQSIPQLQWIIRRSDFHKWRGIYTEALWALSKFSGQEMHALSRLKKFYESVNDGLGVLLVAESLLESHPDHFNAKATAVHLCLCHGVNPDQAHRRAEECYEQFPDSPVVRMIYLLSLHIKGEDEAAFRLLKTFTPAERGIQGMEMYFHYFDWIGGTRPDPPRLDPPPPGYLDLEIHFLRDRVNHRLADILPSQTPRKKE